MLESKNLRACGYFRVSTNNLKQQSSLINQKRQIMKYINDNNFIFVNNYHDIKSGTTSYRSGLTELIDALKNNEFDIIIVKDISRLTRNTTIAAYIKNILIKYQKHLICLDDSINTLLDFNSISKLISNTQFFEDESRALSNRMKNTKILNCHDGKFNGSTPPYGYFLKDLKLIKRDDTSPFIVKRIFREFISGKSFTEIATELNKDKIKTPSQIINKSNASSQWRDTTVRGILKNISYCGHLLQHKTTTLDLCDKRRKSLPEEECILAKNTHEAIISLEDFELVQKKLNSKILTKTRQSIYLYSNILFCKDCGSKMHKRTNSRGEKYYVCGTYNKKGASFCSMNKLKELELTRIIIDNLIDYVFTSNLNIINKNTDNYVKNLINNLKKSLEDCDVKIKALENQKAEILTLFPKFISADEYNNFIKIRNDKIFEIKDKKEKLTILINKTSKEDIIKIVDEAKSSLISVENFNSEILHTFINRIEFSKTKSLTIFYNCNNH